MALSKPLDDKARQGFIDQELKRGLSIYQCNGCSVMNSNRKKPKVCCMCQSQDIKVVKERM